ncbi:MAG: META domain-containing protein [Rhodobacteraceae bacterium]|nr:MAG: META domain-containing protein [Paracoccaceae bacterium]
MGADMRHVLLLFLILLSGLSSAQARDGAVRLEWPEPVGAEAEAVIMMRNATGEVVLSIREDLAAGVRAQRIVLPSLPRAAYTIQAGVVQDGTVVMQSPDTPLAGNIGLEISMGLSRNLAIGFADVWDCEAARPYQILYVGGGLELIRDHERMRFDPDPENDAAEEVERFITADGHYWAMTGNRAILGTPEGTQQTCSVALFAPLLPLNALATDLSWAFELNRDEALITLPGIDTQMLATRGLRVSAPRDGSITLQGDPFQLRLTQERCRLRDGDLIYPITAHLTSAEQDITSAGCAGDPRALLGGGAWQVTALLGQRLDRDTLRNLTIEVSGDAISGRGTCNRYVGVARIEAFALAFRELGTTRLACPADLRNIELRFLDALEAVTGFDISPAGVLTLRAGPQAILTAERRAAP